MVKPGGEYAAWLTDLKRRIQSAQIKAAVKVNAELLLLYWDLGREILEREKTSGWGDKLILQLSKDLLKAFPDMKGFSVTNLKYIRRFYRFYTHLVIGPQVAAQLRSKHADLVRDAKDAAAFEPQAAARMKEGKKSATKIDLPVEKKISPSPETDTETEHTVRIVQYLVTQIPWGHNREIITRCKEIDEALFYVSQTRLYNWSRNVLLHQMDGRLYQRQGKAVNNFESTLPSTHADLARELLKDPYVFDFLSLGPEHQERDLENALVDHVTKFLLELGQGFAYVGRQYPLQVEGEDYRIDLLFYHLRLRGF